VVHQAKKKKNLVFQQNALKLELDPHDAAHERRERSERARVFLLSIRMPQILVPIVDIDGEQVHTYSKAACD
jgi:hypothetical protein